VNTSFQFGTTTAYGQATSPQKTGPDNVADHFSAQLTGLPTGTTIHYRAFVTTDFGTFAGADQTLTTQSLSPPPSPPPPPNGTGHTSVRHATVSGTTTSVLATCTGTSGATCAIVLQLTVTETFKGRRLVGVNARGRPSTHRRELLVGTTSVTLNAGQSKTVRVTLNRAGRNLRVTHPRLKATLRLLQVTPDRHLARVASQTVVFTVTHHPPRR
jgi:hypothetical protein